MAKPSINPAPPSRRKQRSLHTLVTQGRRSNGVATWGLLILLAFLAIANVIVFSQRSSAQTSADPAPVESTDQYKGTKATGTYEQREMAERMSNRADY